MPGVKAAFPIRSGKMYYWFVLAGALVAIPLGAFVSPAVGGGVVLSLQPVNTAPPTRLSRTKRMYILFIVG
jgi:hypothetical protein